jgi:hypothetical protein
MAGADQADVLRSMMLARQADAARPRLWAVAGNSLVSIQGNESIHAELVSAPANLGPLRSVRGDGNGGLLLGAQSGVVRIEGESAVEYRDAEVSSRLGFNSVVRAGDRIWAAHSEAGLVAWHIDDSAKPITAIRPATAKMQGFSPRNLALLDSDRIIFSSGSQLAIASANGEITPIDRATEADILAVIVQNRRVLTVHSDGQVCSLSKDDFTPECLERRAGRIAAAAALPWMGDVRLLMATEDGPIVCAGPDDEVLTQYTSAYQGLRMVAGTDDSVAAVTQDRQRLILWHPWESRKPFADLFVYGLARHRIADIAFG